MVDKALAAWLLDSDPALRWQVERDVVGAPPEGWQATRARVAHEGFGARLLDRQDDDGQWAGGAFFPADLDFHGPEAQPGAGQPWTATTWVLNDLREWGVDAQVLKDRDTPAKLAKVRWEYEDLPYWGGEVDCCINSWTLSNGLWLGVDVSGIAQWFVEHQLEDGGWNCEWVEGSTVGSFHSTLNTLKGLLDLELAGAGTEATRAARRAGEEYLLRRELFRRLSTGEPVGPWVDRFVYPARHRYSVLNALDHFRRASEVDGPRHEARMAEAVEMVRAQREPDGTWPQSTPLAGRVWFEVDAPEGEPSRWLTLQGTRVLRWWENA